MNSKKDKIEGTCREYYKNGKIKVEWNCKNGKLEGITKRYDEDGKLLVEVNYNKT